MNKMSVTTQEGKMDMINRVKFCLLVLVFVSPVSVLWAAGLEFPAGMNSMEYESVMPITPIDSQGDDHRSPAITGENDAGQAPDDERTYYTNGGMPIVVSEPQAAALMSNDVHEVVAGDTLWGIIRKYNLNISPAELARMNGISNPDRINIGDKIILPSSQANQEVSKPPMRVLSPESLPSNGRSEEPSASQSPLEKLYKTEYSGAGVTIDLKAIATIESEGNSNAVNSGSGATGLFQVLGALDDWNNCHDKSVQYARADMKDPHKNKQVADWYLHVRIPQLLQVLGVEVTTDNVLAAYAMGPGALRSHLRQNNGTIVDPVIKGYIAKYNALSR